jgi:PAS domain S-box-containing protein
MMSCGKSSYDQLEERVNQLEKQVEWYQQAYNELLDRNETLRLLVDHAPQAMAVADLDHDRLLDVNAALCRDVERSKSRLLGGSLSQLGIHDRRDKLDFKERLRSYGWLQGRLLQLCPRSGPAKDISVDAKTIRSSTNQRLAVLCFQPATFDQAEDALQESRERFELAMKACRDGLWDWDIESGHVYYSPAYSAMLGFSEKELRGKIDFWKRRLHPEDKEHTLRANQDCIENRRDRFEVEFRMQTRHGHWRWILGRGQAVARDTQGRATRMIGTHTDITERKRAEEALRASEKRFRDLSSLLPQSVWEVDLQGRITYINEAALSIFGYTWAELDNDLSVFDVLAAEDRQRAEAAFRRLLSRTQPDRGTSFSIVLPERQPRADGTGTDALDQTEHNAGPAQPATILVVEDEQTIRQITREHLEQQGFRVIEAENGQAAFRLFRKQSEEIDLILLDLAMPGMNGEEVIEKIKALQAKPKIIVLSGYSRHDMASEPERYGIHEFLRKPLRLESLISSINSALNSD